jgi:hypothetical protein
MMPVPAHIEFRGLVHSDTLEGQIRERLTWLQQFYSGIVGCRVLLEVPHRHHHDDRHFHVCIGVNVPGGGPIVVSHEPSLHGTLKDVEDTGQHKDTEIEREHRYARVAIHEAFDVARRRLQDFAREQRGAVKTHEVGTPVASVEERGEKGPRASTVRLLGKHHYVAH